jgi:hypothetical protein
MAWLTSKMIPEVGMTLAKAYEMEECRATRR